MDAFCIQWVKKKGAWLSVAPSTVNRIDIEVQEWRDTIFLKFSIKILKFPQY